MLEYSKWEKVMFMGLENQYIVFGEGIQAKKLLRDKFNLSEKEVVQFVMDRMFIARSTAENYMSRKKVPYETFRQFIEEIFECKYYDLIRAPEDQIMEYLEEVNRIVESTPYEEKKGLLETIEYLKNESFEIEYLRGSYLSQIMIASLAFELKMEGFLEILDNVMKESKKNDESMFTYALLAKAYVLNQTGELTEAFSILEKSKKVVYTDDKIESRYKRLFFYQLSLLSKDMKEYKKAKKNILIAIELSKTNMETVRGYLTLGLIYKLNGKYPDAIRTYKKILSITENTVDQAMAYNNIANVYIKKQNFGKAENYVLSAIKLSRDDKKIDRRLNYYDTLLEIIMAANYNQEYFYEVYSRIKVELEMCYQVYTNRSIVNGCIEKLVNLIVHYDDIHLADEFICFVRSLIENNKSQAMMEKSLGFILFNFYDNFFKGGRKA